MSISMSRSTPPYNVDTLWRFASRQRLHAFLDGKTFRKIANNTTVWEHEDGSIDVIYHHTPIIHYFQTAYGEERVRINSGAWHTYTTKQRINQFLWFTDWKVYQDNYRWKFRNFATGQDREFMDGEEVMVHA